MTVKMTLMITMGMVILSALSALPSTIMATLKVPENWTHVDQEQISFCVEVRYGKENNCTVLEKLEHTFYFLKLSESC